MKFCELPLGQQFEWQGESYSKISPLMARHLGSGEQKLIARATRVRLLETSQSAKPATAVKSGAIDAKRVRAAAHAFHAETGGILKDLTDHLPPEVLEQTQRALAKALESFLAEIEEPESHNSDSAP